jgi:periplasmic protein TonB
MSQYLDTFDQRESLGKHWIASLVVHVAAVAVLSISGYTLHKTNDWGSPNPGGGAMSVGVVKTIPLPSRQGLENPLANDSKTTVPLPPAKAKPEPKAKAPEANAIPIPSKKADKKKPAERASAKTTYRAPGRDELNQLFSDTGPALKSSQIGQNGAGAVGLGEGSTLGNRYGWYVDLLRTKVGQHWTPDQHTPTPTIVTFTLMKDGSTRDIKIAQRSGNTIADFAAQRAILDSSPFPPLPDGAGNSTHIEIVFNARQ